MNNQIDGGKKTKQKPILTKTRVFKRLLRNSFIMSISLGFGSFFLMISLSGESMSTSIRAGIIVGVGAFLYYSLEAIPHILRLNRQEKVMGFDFNKEMKKRKIRGDRINNHWYINQGIVIRKGYIKRIEKVKYVSSIYTIVSAKTEAKITFRTIDKKTKTIIIGDYLSDQLEDWVKKRPRPR